jgi:hypothetical protein
MLRDVGHMSSFSELSSHWIIIFWCYVVLVTCVPSESCHYIELSSYDATWYWTHFFLLRVVITFNYHLLVLRGVGHMSSFWEVSSHWIIILWCYVVLVICLPSESFHHIELSSYDATWCWSHVFLLRVVITLNYHLMMLRSVGHVSSFWELSSHWIISLRCCMVSKSGRLAPGAITVMGLSMAYLSSTSSKFVDLMFFFLKHHAAHRVN